MKKKTQTKPTTEIERLYSEVSRRAQYIKSCARGSENESALFDHANEILSIVSRYTAGLAKAAQ